MPKFFHVSKIVFNNDESEERDMWVNVKQISRIWKHGDTVCCRIIGEKGFMLIINERYTMSAEELFKSMIPEPEQERPPYMGTVGRIDF